MVDAVPKLTAYLLQNPLYGFGQQTMAQGISMAPVYSPMQGASRALGVPIEQPEDESILLDLLHSRHWDVAGFQRKRLAQRMARHVSDCIMRKPFKPMRPGA